MQNRIASNNINYKVYVRMRPIDYQQKMIEITNETVAIKVTYHFIKDPTNKSSERQQFTFSSVCQTQDQVFRVAEPMLQKLIEGHNSCLLSYGQTGSGKSFTIFGQDEKFSQTDDSKTDKRGIIPRAMEYLIQKAQEFEEIREFVITASLAEVYLDQVRDLGKALDSKSQLSNFENENLTIYENTNGQIMVKDLSQITLRTLAELYELLQAAFHMREKIDLQSPYSNKAHTIFTLNLIQKDKENDNLPFMNATMQFVDLAGSERIAKSLTEGHKFQEAILVNSSLTALGKCLTAISQMNSKNIPYRESKLTRILQNCLNSQGLVALVVNLNPNENNFEECLSTLQYAERSKGSQAKISQDEGLGSPGGPFPGQDKLIKKLNDEIAELKSKLDFVQKENKLKLNEIQSLLGIEVDLDKLFSKSYAKDLNQFKLQKDAAAKLESQGIYISELEQKNQKLQDELNMMVKDDQIKQERHTSLKIEYEAKIRKLTDELMTQKTRFDNEQVQSKDQLEKTIKTELEKNQKKLEQKVSVIMNLPQNISNKTQEVQKVEDIKRLSRLEVEKEYKSQIENLRNEYSKLLKAAQEQYEFYLNQKNEELDSFIKQFKKYQEKKKLQSKEIKQELFDLYDLIQKAFRVIEKIENGAYSSGIRSFNIPHMDKPILPSRNKYRNLFKYLDQRSLQFKVTDRPKLILPAQSQFIENTDLTLNLSKLDDKMLMPFTLKLREELQQALAREKELQKRVFVLEEIQKSSDLVTLVRERDEYKSLYMNESKKQQRKIATPTNILIRPMTQQSRYRS